MNSRSILAAGMLVVAVGAAQAAVTQGAPACLAGNADLQRRIADDLAAGRLELHRLSALQDRSAALYRLQANAVAHAGRADLARLVCSEQRALARRLFSAEHAVHAARPADAAPLLRARVATARNAELQRWIVQGLQQARLSATQTARFEIAQANLALLQAAFERGADFTLEDATRLQHLQNVEEWAIRDGRAPS